eukprot:1160072-Pelagomonas_calceolata.AAC.3
MPAMCAGLSEEGLSSLGQHSMVRQRGSSKAAKKPRLRVSMTTPVHALQAGSAVDLCTTHCLGPPLPVRAQQQVCAPPGGAPRLHWAQSPPPAAAQKSGSMG